MDEFKARAAAFYGNTIAKRSALNIRNGGGVLESILAGGKYRTVLEIGTFKGLTAAFMAQFCDRVITIDLVSGGRLEQVGDQFDPRSLWGSLGLDNIDLHLVADDDEKAALISGMKFDFAFIDGDHTGDAPARDFEMVQRCGAVLFHDYGETNGVTQFVDSLPRGRVKIMDIFAFWRGKKCRPRKSRNLVKGRPTYSLIGSAPNLTET